MKSHLSRKELLGLVGVLAVVLLAGGAAFLGFGALGEKQAEAQALADQMGNPALAALLTDPGGVSRAGQDSTELQKLDLELREKDGALLQKWAEGTRKAEGEGQEWAKDPGKWKDRLIQVQSKLQKEAAAGRVQLGPDFYLGLEAYRQKSPTAEEVPGLAMHLSVAERLVEHLIQARQATEQYPTSCDFKSLASLGAAPAKTAEAAPAPAPVQPGAPPVGGERKTFRMEIRCSPEVLYDYVRRLTQDDWLLILTNLAVENDQPTFPLRSQIAKTFSVPEAGAEPVAGAKKEKKLLEILAGKESVTALLEVDFVAWKNPEEAKAAPAAAPAP